MILAKLRIMRQWVQEKSQFVLQYSVIIGQSLLFQNLNIKYDWETLGLEGANGDADDHDQGDLPPAEACLVLLLKNQCSNCLTIDRIFWERIRWTLAIGRWVWCSFSCFYEFWMAWIKFLFGRFLRRCSRLMMKLNGVHTWGLYTRRLLWQFTILGRRTIFLDFLKGD